MSANLRAVPTVFPPQPCPPQMVPPGWMWDGTRWVCDPCDNQPMPPFPCPPPGFPTPCPPWFPPPAGQAPWYPGANGGVSFSATPPVNPIRGNLWWDGMVLHLFDGAAWVSIGPQTAGASGVMGVTDGSLAAPGFVGEVITLTANGSVSVIPPPGSPATNFTALVVPAGDWNIQETVTITNLTNGVFYDEIGFTLMNGSTQIGGFNLFGQFTTTTGGLNGGTYSCAVIQLSVSASTTISSALTVVAIGGGTSGTASYNATTKARRMR